MWKDAGLTSLKNVTNSCYINAIVQILRHTEYLNKVLDQRKHNKNNSIIAEWDDLRRLMWSKRSVISPKRWIWVIGNENESLNNTDQQDVVEYLMYVLEKLHDGARRKVNMNISGQIKNGYDVVATKCYEEYKRQYENNFSEIITGFYGMEVTTITNNSNEIQSLKTETFSVINLAIVNEHDKDIHACLRAYCTTEKLDGDNKWYNEKTKEKEDAHISTNFFQLPNVLIIAFKKYTGAKMRVDFPIEELDMSDYVIGGEKHNYTLYGVCNHIGSVTNGHYFSYIRYNQRWYIFNDEEVMEIGSKRIVSNAAYCLFYKRNVE